MSRIVVGGVMSSRSRVLVIRRARGIPYEERLCFPGGVALESETKQEAAIREVREELGLDCKAVGTAGMFYDANIDAKVWFIKLAIKKGQINITFPLREVMEVMWLTPAQILADRLVIPSLRFWAERDFGRSK